MVDDFASLVFLSYNRPQFIFDAIESASSTADYPHEIIVVDDGSLDEGLVVKLRAWQVDGRISTLVTSVPGHNEGVGHSINVGFALATGDPIVKIDQDMTFEPGWLKKVCSMIDSDPSIGMAGVFKYEHWPVEWRKMEIPWVGSPVWNDATPPYHYVKDFVGSVMIVPRLIYETFGPFPEHSAAYAEDIEYKTTLREEGFNLILPDTDLAHNHGFGPGPSTIVSMQGDDVVVTPIQTGPMVHFV